ncbi:ArsR/SmtB family transcription factor [Streptomyces profundus]|uniref:ArsR/SmtB family transcription factor n=1 Tax=Streptomyces profundus TaxID=2867410 RepID=UPI001D160B43|nr:helix-turn-helix domain-containing protein [Streptomyces sp. MA3_2.13]UED88166.1 helix-turn-helix domain-containing protein [Streptomyces sp. MA3_2.13]
MLRFHLTDADLARIRVATAPDPLWETVLGIQQLPNRRSHAFHTWRGQAREELTRRNLGGPIRLMNSAAPAASYFPDFLTPPEAQDGLTTGLEALRATPPSRLNQELTRLAHTRRLPHWCHELAHGKRDHLRELASAIRDIHHTIIAPDWTKATQAIETDRLIRARAIRDGGLHGLLESLRPTVDWQPPILHVPYPEDRDVHLRGHGLRLIPSYFCWRTPVALADPHLPQILVYPAARATTTETRTTATRLGPLTGLLGHTRARTLLNLADAATTGELARLLGVSPSTASEHVSALRDAGLTHRRREGGRVIHSLTPLGTALLRGENHPPSATTLDP